MIGRSVEAEVLQILRSKKRRRLPRVSANTAYIFRMWIHRPRRIDSPYTKQQYWCIGEAFLRWMYRQGMLDLTDVTYPVLLQWQRSLSSSSHTIRAHVFIVQSLLAYATDIGYLSYNPGAALETPATEWNVRHRTLDPKYQNS